MPEKSDSKKNTSITSTSRAYSKSESLYCADTSIGPSGPSSLDVELSNHSNPAGPLGSPPPSENIGLSDYLTKYIDGYLLGDLQSIGKKILPEEKWNASYPMILSICAGLEFLGALLKPPIDEKYSRDHGDGYFGHYWKYYLSGINATYSKNLNGQIARDLIRNGLAHHFIIKPGIGAVRSQSKRHLTVENRNGRNMLVIDADALHEDFRKSYIEKAKPKILDGQEGTALASRRLGEILLAYDDDSIILRKLNSSSQNNCTSQTTTVLESQKYLPTTSC